MAAPSGPGTRARRRGPSRGDLKESAILETAEQLLGEKSIHEIGVDELAKGADISRPSFYFYFESKYSVLQALVERVVQQTYAEAEQWLGRTDDPPGEAVRRSIEAAARHWRENGPVLRAAVETWGVTEMGPFWEEVTSGFVEAAAAQIEREREAGLAIPGPPSAKALATALIWMNERCFYTASLEAEPSLEEDELIDTLTAVWLRSVYGPAGVEPAATTTSG
jgi:TetR/AcrR family transcriptional regulator, ethionamide resistance regulator